MTLMRRDSGAACATGTGLRGRHGGGVLALSPLEHRRLPWWDAQVRATGVRSTAAGVLICLAGVALVLLAKNGLAGAAVTRCSDASWWPRLPRRACAGGHSLVADRSLDRNSWCKA